jgi:hypothetical protein
MIKLNLRDKNFCGEPSCCHRGQNKYIEWVRENTLVSNSCFITDLCLPDIQRAKGLKRSVAWLMEPKAIHPFTYDFVEKNNKLFDYILTFDRRLLEQGKNFVFYPHGRCWIQNKEAPTLYKPKTCSIIASKKASTLGHRMRHEVARLFKDKVDLYGNAYKEIKDTDEALNQYQFSVTIENSQQDFYFTEKLIDCFVAKTVPIYWGCPSIAKFFNPDGMIIFNDFNELNNIIKNLSIEKYESMLPAIEYNYECAQNYLIPEDWIYKNLSFLMN